MPEYGVQTVTLGIDEVFKKLGCIGVFNSIETRFYRGKRQKVFVGSLNTDTPEGRVSVSATYSVREVCQVCDLPYRGLTEVGFSYKEVLGIGRRDAITFKYGKLKHGELVQVLKARKVKRSMDGADLADLAEGEDDAFVESEEALQVKPSVLAFKLFLIVGCAISFLIGHWIGLSQ